MRRAKTGSMLLVLLLLGCGRQPDFDERYAKASQQLEASATAIDAEIAASASASEAAAAITGDTQKTGG